jgi:hypothetical protein
MDKNFLKKLLNISKTEFEINNILDLPNVNNLDNENSNELDESFLIVFND